MCVAEGVSPSPTRRDQETCVREGVISKTILLAFREKVETSIDGPTNRGRRWPSKKIGRKFYSGRKREWYVEELSRGLAG
jgi:hypothetical protein